MVEHNRRHDDGGKTEIDELIKAENDPKNTGDTLSLTKH